MKNLVLYLIGRFTSLFGNGLMDIVLPIYILERTSSGSYLGLFLAITAIPSLLLIPIFGNYLENFNKKYVMIVTDILQSLLFLSLCFVGNTDLTIFAIFMTISITIEKVFDVSSSSIMSQIIKEEHIEMGNSWKSILDNIALISSPVIGTFIYYNFGIKGVFMINSVTFLLSALTEFFLAYNYENMPMQKQTIFKNLKEVSNYVFEDKRLCKLFIAVMLLNFIIAPLSSVILPYLLLHVEGLSTYQFGIGNSAYVLGSLLGASLILFKKNKFNLATLLNFNSSLFILIGLLCYVFSGQTKIIFLILVGIKLLTGVGVSMVNIPLISSFQKTVPATMQTRFFSLLAFVGGLLIPLGEFIFGQLSDLINVIIILVFAGVLMIILTYILLVKSNTENHKIRAV